MTTLTGTSPLTLSVDEDGDFTLTYEGEAPPPPPPPPNVNPNHASAVYTVNENLVATIPLDGSDPQKTEGTQILAVTMACKSATSKVRVQFDGHGGHVTGDNALISALFIDNETNARRSVPVNPPGPPYVTLLRLVYEWMPGDTAEHTYKINVGASSGVMRLNGWGSGVKMGSTAAATLLVDELFI